MVTDLIVFILSIYITLSRNYQQSTDILPFIHVTIELPTVFNKKHQQFQTVMLKIVGYLKTYFKVRDAYMHHRIHTLSSRFNK